jgi:hypothetical protein
MAFITVMAVRVSCQISQNAAAEAPLDAEVAFEAELLSGAVVPLEAEMPLGAGVLLGAGLPQADSAKARTAVSNGVASNPSRPVIRGVRSMPVVDEGNAWD